MELSLPYRLEEAAKRKPDTLKTDETFATE